MIRYEVKTKHKSFVGCESTIKDAKDYIQALEDNGVEIVNVEYFNNEKRVSDIRNGLV